MNTTPIKEEPVVAIVENDPAMLKAMQRLLRAAGYRSQGFKSAEAFLEREGKTGLQCLILDIDLDGMSGIELQRKLVAAACAPPIIFMTGQDDEALRAEAHAAGALACLMKPFASHLLLRELEAVLAMNREDQESSHPPHHEKDCKST
jgi:FixJ family two-component response regulator